MESNSNITIHSKVIYECMLGTEEWWITNTIMYFYLVYPAYYFIKSGALKCFVADTETLILLVSLLVGWPLNMFLQWFIHSHSPCIYDSGRLADPLYETQISFHYSSFFIINWFIYGNKWDWITRHDIFFAPIFMFLVAVFSENATVFQAFHGMCWGLTLGTFPSLFYHFILNMKNRKIEKKPPKTVGFCL